MKTILRERYKFFEKSVVGGFLISTSGRDPVKHTREKLLEARSRFGFSLLGWFALHGYIVSNNNIHRPAWTATGISSRQRRFHYRVRLRDAYPGESRVHKAHQMSKARRDRAGAGKKREARERTGVEKKRCGEVRRKIQEGAAGITVYVVDI